MQPSPPGAIVFGVCAGRSTKLRDVLAPSIGTWSEGARVVTRVDQRSIAEAYNSIVEEVRAAPDLEFLVLLHDDVELTGELLPALREAVSAHPDAGVIGAVGGLGFRGARWWLTPHKRGQLTDGQLVHDYSSGPVEAETVDGLLLAFPAAVVPSLRFDERYRGFHLYDADICRQLRQQGLPVVVTDLPVVHHSKPGFGSAAQFYREEARYLTKWRQYTRPRGAVDLVNALLRVVYCTARARVFGGRP